MERLKAGIVALSAVLGGWLILGDKMTAREYAGCGMMHD